MIKQFVKRGSLLLVVVGLTVACSVRSARAAISWWDYLEEMSGPGPFYKTGPLGIATIDTGVACHLAEPQEKGSQWVYGNSADCALDPARTGPRHIDNFFSLRLGASSTASDRALFKDRPNELQGKVTAWTVDGWLRHRYDAVLEVGMGAGTIFFSGGPVDRHAIRPTVTPISILFTPIGLLHPSHPQKYDGLFGIRFEQMIVVGRLDANDFNSRSTSSYRTDQFDFIRRFSFTIDLSPFIFPQARPSDGDSGVANRRKA